MTTLAESLISSSSRPVKLRMRPDLQTRRHRYHGRTFWVVKEPVALNYFRFHEEEFSILCMLDGTTSLDDIKEQFEREFTPQKITFQDLQQFIGMLHRSGLVISDASGQGRQLCRRGDERRRKELLGKFANLFALRFRGIDPERLLNRLLPWFGWIFSPLAITLVLMFAASALMLVLVQFDVFRARLPTFHEFFGAKNWFWLMLTMGSVKVLHEFGHGLSCKYYGGECHEMGLMLLVFTPCLYCNVSDSWMLPSKYQRAFIGAAGMYVELILASIATYLWWLSDPATLINQLSLSVMFICSVSTIMFNGNPLLRYDGYYIVMDLLEIPNLRQKSTEVLRRFMTELCLGIEQPENPFLPQRHRFFFGLFTIASVAYRWLVVFSILFFLNKVFEPYGLKVIGQAIAAAGLFGLIVQPLWQLARFFYLPGRMSKVKPQRLIATAVAVAAALIIIAFVPVPHNVRGSVEVSPRNAEAVYAVAPGILREISVRPGDRVVAGTTLARLENLELERNVRSLEGQREEMKARLESLRRQVRNDEKLGVEIPQTQEMLLAIEQQLQEKREELERLEITATVDGIVLPPPVKAARPEASGMLPTWRGTPFDRQNRDAFLTQGDEICKVGDPKDLEALLIIDQGDIDFVRKGNPVRIKLDAYPFETFVSHIEQVGLSELKSTSIAMSAQAGGDVDTKSDPSGAQRPLSTSYQARAQLPDPDGNLTIGLRGKAKIKVGWQPLGYRIYRFVIRTFHFQL